LMLACKWSDDKSNLARCSPNSPRFPSTVRWIMCLLNPDARILKTITKTA
jgi:hypothetical protein